MTNPYRLEPPALISFSGGRTSGVLLHHVLEAYDGTLAEGSAGTPGYPRSALRRQGHEGGRHGLLAGPAVRPRTPLRQRKDAARKLRCLLSQVSEDSLG